MSVTRHPVRALLAVFGLAVLAGALWWRKNPSACPYGQRFWVQAPHPYITSKRMLNTLQPGADERILEIGPGTGYYALDVATAAGTLDIFDIQREMLDHTMRRARERGLTNIVATEGDAQELPYPDSSFDKVYLVTVLGEIPDQHKALQEVARVLTPGGTLVVGELFGDPHWVSPGKLRAKAGSAGLTMLSRVGTPAAYFGVFNKG